LTQCADVAVLEVHDERWRFTHDKLREGLLKSMSTSRSEELHRKVAQAIEAVHPGSSSTAASLAFHWGAAGDYDKEAYYAIQAGNASADLYVDVEARRHYTIAESALDKLPLTLENRQRLVDVLTRHASVSFVADRPDVNLQRLDRTEELLKELPGPDGTPGNDKLRRARLLHWKGRILYYQARARDAIGQFQQLLALAQELNDEYLA